MAISRRQDSTILLGKECNYANQLILGRSSLQQGSPSKHLIPSAPFGPRTFQQGKESPHRLSLNNSIPKDMWRKYMGMPRIRLYGCSAMFQTFPPAHDVQTDCKKNPGGHTLNHFCTFSFPSIAEYREEMQTLSVGILIIVLGIGNFIATTITLRKKGKQVKGKKQGANVGAASNDLKKQR